MKTSDIKEKWNQFRQQKGFLQRISPSHPMDLFLGISERGLAELVLITSIEPAQIKSSKSLEIEKGKRNDGRWATQISCVEKENEDIFARLCLDLIEMSENAKNEQEGLNHITKRFLAWQKLFATLNNDLSISVLKGLVGEISFIREVLIRHHSKDEIICAWQGPDGADRDFAFDFAWFEIKAISTGKSKVSISSLNQLDSDNTGYLVKFDVDESSSTDPSAVSVSQMVQLMRSLLQDSPAAEMLFERKLVSLGYADKKSYNNIFFVHSGPTYFAVDDSFPRLTPKSVPAEVCEAEYCLDLPAIENWKVNEESIWN